jgi:hypothetical protein
MSMEDNGGIIAARDTPCSSTRTLWQSYQRKRLVADQEDLDEGNDGFRIRNVSFILVEFF